jgi:hypothetical protein
MVQGGRKDRRFRTRRPSNPATACMKAQVNARTHRRTDASPPRKNVSSFPPTHTGTSLARDPNVRVRSHCTTTRTDRRKATCGTPQDTKTVPRWQPLQRAAAVASQTAEQAGRYELTRRRWCGKVGDVHILEDRCKDAVLCDVRLDVLQTGGGGEEKRGAWTRRMVRRPPSTHLSCPHPNSLTHHTHTEVWLRCVQRGQGKPVFPPKGVHPHRGSI